MDNVLTGEPEPYVILMSVSEGAKAMLDRKEIKPGERIPKSKLQDLRVYGEMQHGYQKAPSIMWGEP